MRKDKKTTQQTSSSRKGKLSKAERHTLAIKRAKRNSLIGKIVVSAVAIVFIALLVHSVTRPELGSRLYESGPQSITLYDDGRFSFIDCRFVRTGRFTEIINDDDVTVRFMHNNITVYGNIANDILTIPNEWDTGKGHNPRLRLQ